MSTNRGRSFLPCYYTADHLGSVRVITSNTGAIEEQTTADIGYLDYGARMYDTELGCWFVQDPLTELAPEMTPYKFRFNNPGNMIVPDGLFET